MKIKKSEYITKLRNAIDFIHDLNYHVSDSVFESFLLAVEATTKSIIEDMKQYELEYEEDEQT